jgi:glycosyltransferase involved in cell wall biosynthesis
MLRSEIERRDGGAESIRNLVDGIRRCHGVALSVVSSFGTYPSHVPYASYPWRDSKVIPLLGYFYRMVKKVALDHDIIVLILPNPAFGWLADLIKRQVKKPTIVNYESRWHIFKDYHFGGDNLLFANIGRLIAFNRLTSRLSRKLCDQYVISTDFQKKELIELGYKSNKVTTIPNSTNLRKYHYQFDARLAQKNRPVVMYLGHFNYSKGVDLLVQAMPSVLKEFPNVKLSLAWSGSGSEYPRVMRLISKHGLIDATEMATGIVNVPEYLSLADVVVLPYRSLSRTRIIPSLLLETFSVGVPLVVCDCDPIRDIIEHYKTGIVAPVNDPISIGEGITVLLKNEGLREIMVRSQHEIATRQFSHTVIAEKYYHMFEELLNG